MKKLSLLVALALMISIGGVYATWVYSQSSDVADITSAKAITMTAATFTGTDGTFAVDTSGLSMVVDPLPGTAHDTGLVITGELIISFTPNQYANETVKGYGVAATYEFGISNNNWTYDDGDGASSIIVLTHTGEEAKHDIAWTRGDDGVFRCTLDAATIAEHISLTQFTLDTKADYDAFDAVLTQGQVTITVSDGVTSQA